MRPATRSARCARAMRRLGVLVLMPVAILVLSANDCDEGECFYDWVIEGDTGISVGDAPRLAVTLCFDESCAEGVVDTAGVVIDGATVDAQFEGPWPHFQLRRAHPAWIYEARWFSLGLDDGRHAVTIEVQDDATGESLFRIRHEASTRRDDACRPQTATADATPRGANP